MGSLIESNLQKMRLVDGKKVAFVGSESYFAGFFTPSMYSTARENGADIVLLLAEGKTEADITDDDIRKMLSATADELNGEPQ